MCKSLSNIETSKNSIYTKVFQVPKSNSRTYLFRLLIAQKIQMNEFSSCEENVIG